MNFAPLLLSLFLLGCNGEEGNTTSESNINRKLCNKNNKTNTEDWNIKALLQMIPEEDKKILITKGLTEKSMFKKIIKALIESEKNKEEQKKKDHAPVVKKVLIEETEDKPKKGTVVGPKDAEQDVQDHVERIPRWRYKYRFFPRHEYLRDPYGNYRYPSYMEKRARYMKPTYRMNEQFPEDWEVEKYSSEVKHRVKRGTNEVLQKTDPESVRLETEKKKSEEKYIGKLEKVERKEKEEKEEQNGGEKKKEETKGRKEEDKEEKKEGQKGEEKEEKKKKTEGQGEKLFEGDANKTTGLAIYQDQRSLNSSQANNSSSSASNHTSTDPGHPHIHQPSQVWRFFETIKNMFSSMF